ncbi:MAG: Holliday junction branch migration protein RuvA [Candidatus Nealsonbacteria bacterium CG10_big_fil_rev_8_21_14_0_10_36_24]|uniref:Holliday junction branch migration complex subunit RuvA n=2 Tax=Candidatus Nealsoniibacteriota TaxID=1817911 RepID=A0A2H0YNW9_9BACT|nr:MAG: Holliday junction branch migration protein RuvA [Candidatus Nealsonbacteria bacterium CG10_big_fil_rev_8_21_14_0_10_36_24]PIS40178.1 MAG: Holliday junction branch migration protein RuvA [Candidatus Nealsonbacteria bacterium CG08_land_8_20_14_0_20_36_22]
MIAYLKGTIIIKKEKFIVLDVKGIGYKVFLSKKALSNLPAIGDDLKIFCFLNVRENAMELYGFLDEKELEFFEILDSIRGIGPKAALEISSLGPLDNLKERILKQDENIFAGIPGIGKKKAMAIILELSGKLRDISKEKKISSTDEAEEGLINLGFPRQKAKLALSKVSKNIKETEQKIKESLKILGK